MSSAEIAVPKPSLIAIVDNIESLWAMVETAETDEERIAAEVEIQRVIETELATKVDSIGWFMRRCDAQVDLLKQMQADIRTGMERAERRKQRVRQMVQCAMERIGASQMRGTMFTASIRQGAESVDVTDPLAIPPMYNRIVPATVEPDKVRIKSALKAGQYVPGARLVRGDPTLTIR